ncbi:MULTISPECIES: TIGR03557 family F420-dependent LLM class oxidoreductase [unclassified Streptomyces]|uniref:TIGR03557 family F420-dependent LLM class oxidoreductase n=1 Tax=unclassified Streptomyces TaxID=2593676 RepID=UPI000F44E58E|nr:TIGR03557 family F420-dependent LLM class oxidoreductase [Streptomyces sp. I6]RNL73711.1 TIGR03557 family F420-dependent LLM class oxidoreductase [Streptomyces sp. I6]
MVHIGYVMLTEQAGPRHLVDHALHAEDVGFDFSMTSDHASPWLPAQGHSPYAWSVLGAVAQATTEIPLMTFATCPTMRYHPAVVAQKAATLQILSEGRFRLGLGPGENLNEHIVGDWPSAADVRLEMLGEAAGIIRELFRGEHVSRRGGHFTVDSAKLWDLPDEPPPIGFAVSDDGSCGLAGRLADFMIAIRPEHSLAESFERAGGSGKARVGQLAVCYDTDREAAVRRAHEQFRWFGMGGTAKAELANPDSFEEATRFVRPEDVAEAIPCGDDPEAVVDAVRGFVDAGFTEVALAQIGGGAQHDFLTWAEEKLLPELHTLGRGGPIAA